MNSCFTAMDSSSINFQIVLTRHPANGARCEGNFRRCRAVAPAVNMLSEALYRLLTKNVDHRAQRPDDVMLSRDHRLADAPAEPTPGNCVYDRLSVGTYTRGPWWVTIPGTG